MICPNRIRRSGNILRPLFALSGIYLVRRCILLRSWLTSCCSDTAGVVLLSSLHMFPIPTCQNTALYANPEYFILPPCFPPSSSRPEDTWADTAILRRSIDNTTTPAAPFDQGATRLKISVGCTFRPIRDVGRVKPIGSYSCIGQEPSQPSGEPFFSVSLPHRTPLRVIPQISPF